MAPLIESTLPPVPGSALAALSGATVELMGCRVRLVCGPYEAGDSEGYVAEHLVTPPSFPLRFKRFEVTAEGGGGPSVFNPFSWRTLSPQLVEGEEGNAGCVRLRNSLALPPGIEAGEARGVQACIPYDKGARSRGYVRIGPFKVSLPGSKSFVRLGLQRVAADSIYEASVSGSAMTVKPEGPLEFYVDVATVNFRVSLLYVNTFEEAFRGSEGVVEGNAMAIKTPFGGLALASPEPLKVKLSPGKILVEVADQVKLALGGELEAFRLLAESLYDWNQLPLEPGKRIPGYWSVSSAAAVIKLAARELIVKIVNPTRRPGVLSVQPPFRPRAAMLKTPLGGEELVASHEVRVPSPPCFCGTLVLKGGMFERFAMIRRKALE